MKKKSKMEILIAIVLILTMLSGCGMDKKTAVTADSMDISKSLYQWFLIKSYDEASTKISDSENILNEKIENKSAKDWIEDRAIYYTKRYISVEDKFTELKLVLSSDAATEIDDNFETFWNASGYNRYYEEYGVDEVAFRKVLENQTKEDMIFNHYNEELTQEVSDTEVKTYYAEHCFLLKYIAIPYPESEDEETSEDTIEQIEPLDTTAIYGDYKKRASDGDSIDLLMKEISDNKTYIKGGFTVSLTEDSKYALFQDSSSGVSAGFLKEMQSGKEGTVNYYADEANQYWIIYEKEDVLSLKEEYNTYINTVKEQIALERYSEKIDTWLKDMKLTENKSITRSQDLDKLF